VPEATARQLIELRSTNQASLTVGQFLGHIRGVSVTNVSDPSISFHAAQKLVDDLMDTLLVQPHSEGPSPSQVWSEVATSVITAAVHYDDGRVGRLETDGRSHLFVEDQLGTAGGIDGIRSFHVQVGGPCKADDVTRTARTSDGNP